MSESQQQREPLARISQTQVSAAEDVFAPVRQVIYPRVVRTPLVRTVLHVATGLIVLSAVTVGIYVSYLYYAFPRTDDAYVRANIVGIAPHVSGPITELSVQDNQFVKQGQLL